MTNVEMLANEDILPRLRAAVRAERERCAVVCDKLAADCNQGFLETDYRKSVFNEAAKRIRMQ